MIGSGFIENTGYNEGSNIGIDVTLTLEFKGLDVLLERDTSGGIMELDKKQLQVLEKLSSESSTHHCFIKENLILGLYLDDYWNGEFDDESLYYYHTPEYASAKAAFHQSMEPLLEAGLVERETKDTDSDLHDQATPACYRITKYGRQALDMLKR